MNSLSMKNRIKKSCLGFVSKKEFLPIKFTAPSFVKQIEI